MTKKLFWGLAVLIILISIAGVYFMLQPDPEPIVKYIDTEPDMPPAEPGFKWVWHHNHWDKVPVAQGNALNGAPHEQSSVEMKPKYSKRLKGPPLNIDWSGGGPKYALDWTDPRTAESYRAYYGFYPPTEEDYFQPVQDNFGNWIKHYRNTSVIVKWGKRIGFRPTLDQFARYKQLQEDLALLQTLSVNNEPNPAISLLEEKIRDLVDNAQGEIPTMLPRESIYYGDATTPAQDKIIEAEARKSLYKRMGIEHLYEFYEVDPYKEIKK